MLCKYNDYKYINGTVGKINIGNVVDKEQG